MAKKLGCNYQGYEFGASYPDSVCIEGRLWDADYCDNDARARKAWAAENPAYWKQYRDTNPAYAERNRNLQQSRNQKLRASVIANEDASRPENSPPAGRYRMVQITCDGAPGDEWIVEIAVLTAIPAAEDV